MSGCRFMSRATNTTGRRSMSKIRRTRTAMRPTRLTARPDTMGPKTSIIHMAIMEARDTEEEEEEEEAPALQQPLIVPAPGSAEETLTEGKARHGHQVPVVPQRLRRISPFPYHPDLRHLPCRLLPPILARAAAPAVPTAMPTADRNLVSYLCFVFYYAIKPTCCLRCNPRYTHWSWRRHFDIRVARKTSASHLVAIRLAFMPTGLVVLLV